MGMYENIFKQIGDAREMGNRTPNLEVGEHIVRLKSCEVVESQKTRGQFRLQADYEVVESTVHQPGELRGSAWFVTGEWAEYGLFRSKKFVTAVAESLGDDREIPEICDEMSSEGQYGKGTLVGARVYYVTNRDGTPRQNQKGENITEIEWSAIEQSEEDVATNRAELDAKYPAKAKPGQGPKGNGKAATQTQKAATQPTQGAAKPSILGKYGVKKQ